MKLVLPPEHSLNPDYVPDLIRAFEENDDEGVKGMIAWSLGKLGGNKARCALNTFLSGSTGRVKAYGLGVQAMCGVSSFVGFLTVAWPTAEFAGMAIEGAVTLGYRKELMAIEDPKERQAEYERRVEFAYDRAKAVNAAGGYGIDDVIDPADTRSWIVMGLRSVPPVTPRTEKKYPYIDTW